MEMMLGLSVQKISAIAQKHAHGLSKHLPCCVNVYVTPHTPAIGKGGGEMVCVKKEEE